ncbi:MAG: APC family permease [Methanothrix sp.]
MAKKIGLKRTLGLLEVTISGVGIILGAGIYALIGEAAGLAGNAVWISFALSALIALLTGLSYAELASMFPKAAAEYEYTSHAFGGFLAFLVGWMIIFSGVVGAATVSLGFAGYFQALTGAPILPSAIALLALLSAVLLFGITHSTRLAIVLTTVEALGLVLVIFMGIPYLGNVDLLEMTPLGSSGMLQASALIFFAFIGFEEIVKLSEEAKDPEINIPRGLVLAISASIILYILVAISAVSVLGWEELSCSSAPFSDIARYALGPNASAAISVMALFATTNTVLLMLLASSRIIYGMASSGSLPPILSSVYSKTHAPWIATILSMIIAMSFVFLGDIAFVANVNNFTVFVTFIVINAVLISLRYKKPQIARPFRVPISLGKLAVLPILGILFNLLMLTQLEIRVMAIGLGLGGLGALAALISMRYIMSDIKNN